MIGRMIGIEGISCVGKTTLCRKLSEYTNYSYVEEASTFYKDKDGYPPSASDILQARRNEKFYFELERERWKVAEKLKEQENIVFLDRTLLSTIVVSYALMQYKGFDTMSDVISDYNHYIRNNMIGLPECYIHLEINHEEMEQRNLIRENLLQDDWMNIGFNNAQREFYNQYYSMTKIPVYRMDSSIGIENEIEMVRKLLLHSTKDSLQFIDTEVEAMNKMCLFSGRK